MDIISSEVERENVYLYKVGEACMKIKLGDMHDKKSSRDVHALVDSRIY